MKTFQFSNRVSVKDTAESNREIDINGYLHIKNCVLTKEGVADYLGKEIPEWQELGLDPDGIYKVFRSSEVLEKNSDTFNNMPITLEHPDRMDSESFQEVPTYGATGETSFVKEGVLYNNIVIYDKSIVDLIINGQLKELSCGYFWNVIPSQQDGIDFEIVMIKGNHLAIVKEARIDGACIADSTTRDNEVHKKNNKGVNMKKFSKFFVKDSQDEFQDFNEELANLLAKYELVDKVDVLVKEKGEDDVTEEQDSDLTEEDSEIEEQKDDISETGDAEEVADTYTKDEVNKLLDELREELKQDAMEYDEALEDAKEILGDVECKAGDANKVYRMILDAKGIKHKSMNNSAVRGAVKALKVVSSQNRYKAPVMRDSSSSDFPESFMKRYKGVK